VLYSAICGSDGRCVLEVGFDTAGKRGPRNENDAVRRGLYIPEPPSLLLFPAAPAFASGAMATEVQTSKIKAAAPPCRFRDWLQREGSMVREKVVREVVGVGLVEERGWMNLGRVEPKFWPVVGG